MYYCPIEGFYFIFKVLNLYGVVTNYPCPVILVTLKTKMWKRGKIGRGGTIRVKIIYLQNSWGGVIHNRPLYFMGLDGPSSAAIVWINQTFIFLMVLFCQNSKNLKTVSGSYAKEATNQLDSKTVNRNGFFFQFFPVYFLMSTIIILLYTLVNCLSLWKW